MAANRFRLSLLENSISCWMAPESIVSGSSYAVAIPRAISESRIFLLLLTEKALDSKWIPKEIDRAINSGVLIFPIILEPITLRNGYDFMLSDIQCYYAQSTLDLTIQTTVRQIKTILVPPETSKQDEPDEKNEDRKKTKHEPSDAEKRLAESVPVEKPDNETDRQFRNLVKETKGKVTDQRFRNLVEESKKAVSNKQNPNGKYFCEYEYIPESNTSKYAVIGIAIIDFILLMWALFSGNGVLAVLLFVVFFILLIIIIKLSTKTIYNMSSSYVLYERRFKGNGIVVYGNDCSTRQFDVPVKDIESISVKGEWKGFKSVLFTADDVQYWLICKNDGSAEQLEKTIMMLKKL